MLTSLSRKIHSPQNWRQAAQNKRRSYSRLERSSFHLGKAKKTGGRKKILKRLIILMIVLGVFGWLGATIMIAWASRDLPDPNKLIERTVSQSTKIYDRTGEHLLYEIFHEKKRTIVDLKEIPEYVKWATITIEDKNFYNHTGVAWLSIARATVSNLLGRKTGGGGASTLTQQLIKNAILTSEKTLGRKIKEAILAKQLERRYTKDQILQLYFNEIPYGSSNYGIESASQSYFGKSIKEVTLAEAATLAALPQAPTRYLNNWELLKGRRDYILNKMVEYGHAAEEEAEEAKKQSVKINKIVSNIIAPHFVFYVKEILTEKYGEKIVEQGGLKVITTLDFEKQQMAEEEVKKGVEAAEKKYQATNGALVALDPKTGQILALVGSHDFFDEEHDGQVNVALRPRQPGSSFKPFVYAAAFMKGFTPDTKVYDVETVFKTEIKDYAPHNYDGKEHGIVTLRQALAGSLNIPAVKVLYLTGINNVLDLADQVGYTTLKDRSRFGLSLVLGGAEVKLLEHTAGYLALAREGTTVAISSILEVTDAQGNQLEKWQESAPQEVISLMVARQVTNILSDNEARAFIFGANNSLTLPDRPVATKTGTTNDWRDAWTLGYTPSLVTGVWVGDNDNKAMSKKADGSYVAAPIWQAFMKRALATTPVEPFNPPDPSPPDIKPILLGQGLGEIILPINKLNGKIATTSTPPDLIEQRIYHQDHTILYYLNKDDLFGLPPADPNADPQFTNWEAGVQTWAAKQNYSQETLPIELDWPNRSGMIEISLLSPTQNQTLNQRNLTISAKVSSSNSIKKVIYLLDDQILGSVSEPPYTFQTYLWDTPKGFHTVRVRALDANGNYEETRVDVNLLAEIDPPMLYFVSPKNQSTIYASRFPVSLTINLHQPEKIKSVNISLAKAEGDSQLFATITNPNEKSLILSWSQTPTPDQYTFTSSITTQEGQTYNGGGLNIIVQ